VRSPTAPSFSSEHPANIYNKNYVLHVNINQTLVNS